MTMKRGTESMNKNSEKKFSLKHEVMDWVETITWAVVSIVLIFTFVVRTAVVSGDSMNHTYKHLDRLLISNIGTPLTGGDVVVFTVPAKNENYIKRVIATEGQTIDIDPGTGAVFVDGVVQDEPYIAETTRVMGNVEFPATVPEGHVFVMGDNRNYSNDSRFSDVGMVDTRLVQGKSYLRFFPIESFGPVQ